MTPLQSRMHETVCVPSGLTACLCGAYARVGQAAVLEEREACAQIAADHEVPYSVEHPDETFVRDLQHVVLQAALNYDRDDDEQPERNVAEAVAHFIRTGKHARPKHGLNDEPCASAAIRARAALSAGAGEK